MFTFRWRYTHSAVFKWHDSEERYKTAREAIVAGREFKEEKASQGIHIYTQLQDNMRVLVAITHIPYCYRPGYVAATEGQLRGGWQYSIITDDVLCVREDIVYAKRSEATAAMLSEVNELNRVYGRGTK